jgi:hypothetical protein
MTTLTDALDGEGLTWFSSEEASWEGQAFVSVDGTDAALSGHAGAGGSSWLQTEVEGPGTMEFDWMVKGAGTDTCLLFVDEQVQKAVCSGLSWSHASAAVGPGDHTLRWVFVGKANASQGAAYLDQVRWITP